MLPMATAGPRGSPHRVFPVVQPASWLRANFGTLNGMDALTFGAAHCLEPTTIAQSPKPDGQRLAVDRALSATTSAERSTAGRWLLVSGLSTLVAGSTASD